jgi:hypothetical protein
VPCSVADPDPEDPYVFGPPDPTPTADPFINQAIVRKTLILIVL